MAATMMRTNVFKPVNTRASRANTRPSRRVTLAVRAEAAASSNPLAKFADSIGLPTEEGIFGFRPFAEVFVGRAAMIGFAASIVGEATTGKGTLAQVGLEPTPQLLAVMLGLLGTAVVAGTASTAVKLAQRKMTAKDVARYRNFLGLNNANDFEAAAAAMKRRGDFTSLGDDAAAIAAARAEGMPADRVLSTAGADAAAAAAANEMKAASTAAVATRAGELAAADAAAAAMKASAAASPAGASVSLAARADILEEALFQGYEAKYARATEITNGRWAMVGFLAAILVEAGTGGRGILSQLIMIFKWMGLLGPASGF